MQKKALITGTNTGIGLALAKELLHRDFFVISCCRRKDYFSFLNQELSQVSRSFSLYAFDLESDFLEDLGRIEEECSVPDVLINNAAVLVRETGDFRKDQEGLEQSMRVNLGAPMAVCDYFAPKMLDKDWGRIINISSKMGSLGDNSSGGHFNYRASKAALNMYTINLAHEMSASAVKVFTVHPGWIKTRMGGLSAPDEISLCIPRVLFPLTDEAESFHGQFLCGSEVLPW